jgi:hypothetical protein
VLLAHKVIRAVPQDPLEPLVQQAHKEFLDLLLVLVPQVPLAAQVQQDQ